MQQMILKAAHLHNNPPMLILNFENEETNSIQISQQIIFTIFLERKFCQNYGQCSEKVEGGLSEG